MKYLKIVLVLCILAACKHDLQRHKIYKNIELPTPLSEFTSYVNSLTSKKEARISELTNGNKVVVFKDYYSGKPYYGVSQLNLENSILTGISLYFINTNEIGLMESSEIDDPSLTPLDQAVWFSNPDNGVINRQLEQYLVNQLVIKYGPKFFTDTLFFDYTAPNGTVNHLKKITKKWENNSLQIALVTITHLFSGNFKLRLDYQLTDSYKEKNKEHMNQLMKNESKF